MLAVEPVAEVSFLRRPVFERIWESPLDEDRDSVASAIEWSTGQYLGVQIGADEDIQCIGRYEGRYLGRAHPYRVDVLEHPIVIKSR